MSFRGLNYPVRVGIKLYIYVFHFNIQDYRADNYRIATTLQLTFDSLFDFFNYLIKIPKMKNRKISDFSD